MWNIGKIIQAFSSQTDFYSELSIASLNGVVCASRWRSKMQISTVTPCDEWKLSDGHSLPEDEMFLFTLGR
jgi:hypothetical protein